MTASLPISRRIQIGGGQGHGSTEDQAKKCVAFPGFALSMYLLDNHDCIHLQHNCGCRGALYQHKGPSCSRKAIPRQVYQKSTVHGTCTPSIRNHQSINLWTEVYNKQKLVSRPIDKRLLFLVSRSAVLTVIAFSILFNVTRFFELRQVESTVTDWTTLERVNDTFTVRYKARF